MGDGRACPADVEVGSQGDENTECSWHRQLESPRASQFCPAHEELIQVWELCMASITYPTWWTTAVNTLMPKEDGIPEVSGCRPIFLSGVEVACALFVQTPLFEAG